MQSNRDVLRKKNEMAASIMKSIGVTATIDHLKFDDLPVEVSGGLNALIYLATTAATHAHDFLIREDFPVDEFYIAIHLVNNLIFRWEDYTYQSSATPALGIPETILNIFKTDEEGNILKEVYSQQIQNLDDETFKKIDTLAYAVRWTLLEIIAANIHLGEPNEDFLERFDPKVCRIVDWMNEYYYDELHIVTNQNGEWGLTPQLHN